MPNESNNKLAELALRYQKEDMEYDNLNGTSLHSVTQTNNQNTKDRLFVFLPKVVKPVERNQFNASKFYIQTQKSSK